MKDCTRGAQFRGCQEYPPAAVPLQAQPDKAPCATALCGRLDNRSKKSFADIAYGGKVLRGTHRPSACAPAAHVGASAVLVL